MRYVDESALQRRQSQTEDDHPPSPMAVGNEGSAAGGEGGGLKFHAPQTPPSNPLTPASPHAGGGGGSSSSAGQFLQSPPPANVRQPSPAQQPSPAGAVGSPFPSAQSPLGAGSPAPRPSPRPSQTGLSPAPGSVGPSGSGGGGGLTARPSARILPQRLWAGANPTPLTLQSFEEICKPPQVQPPQGGPPQAQQPPVAVLAPVHRFLVSLFIRRQLQVWVLSSTY